MMEIEDLKDTGYSKNSTSDAESIGTLVHILDKSRVKPNLRAEDSTPNIDGYLVIVEVNGISVGTVEAQVKTRPKTQKKVVSYSCSQGFLKYCANHNVPVLLIVVDNVKECAYWTHINRKKVIDLIKNLKGKSISVSIPTSNIISKTEKGYIQEWIKIVENSKYITHELLLQKVIDLKEEIKRISKIASVKLGEEDPIYKEVHRFLDLYNGLLDHEFAIIKSIFFQGIWKVGVAIGQYEDSEIDYALFPIKHETNDTQIKKITSKNESRIHRSSLSHHYRSGNPIRNKPQEYSYELVLSDLKEIIENKSLFYINEYTANEYLVEFIDNSPISNLNRNVNSYTVKELNDNLNTFFPIEIEEFSSLLGEKFDPYLLRKLVEFKIQNSNGIINRVYSRKNQSPELLKELLLSFPNVYDGYINGFFPLLKDQLSYYHDFDRVVVIIDKKGTNSIFLKEIDNESPSKITEVFYEDQTNIPISWKDAIAKNASSRIFVIGNSKYKRIYATSRGGLVISGDFPMQSLVYDLLKRRFEEFFSNKTGESVRI